MNILTFDLETSGSKPEFALQSWRAPHDAHITSLVWMHNGTTHGGLNPTRDDLLNMLIYAQENDCTIAGWNVQFDVQWLIAYGLEDEVFKCKFIDGMLLWRHLTIAPEYENSRKSYGLKAAVTEFLPAFSDYELDIDFHDPSPEARAKLHEYNISDVKFTEHLTLKFYNELSKKQQTAARIEAECIPLIAAANYHGMVVDVPAVEALCAKLEQTAEQKLAELAPHGVTEEIIRSPAKLSKLLFDDWGLPPQGTTDTGARSTDKSALHELSLIDPRAKTLREYREALNNKTKFAQTILDSAAYNGNNTTHPQAIIFGTYSGRLTYASNQGRGKEQRQTGFAIHQMKRGAEYRAAIKAPDGFTLMEYDASGQEFRLLALASNDANMLKLCMPGEDAHAFMGNKINPDAQDKKAARQLGKIANLSLNYRAGAKKLRQVARVNYSLDMSQDEADKIHAAYQDAYSQVPVFWKSQITKVKHNKYVETYAGRRVSVDGDWSGDNAWSMGSTAINYRIQGTGADQKYLALAVIKPYLRQIGARFAWDLHDGIYLYVPDDKVHEAAEQIKLLLDNLPYQKAWGFSPSIPLPWDCKSGKSWANLKEYKFNEADTPDQEGASLSIAPTLQPDGVQGRERLGDLGGEDKASSNLVQGDFGSSKPRDNREFLEAIFHDAWPQAWVTSYPLDGGQKSHWFGGRAGNTLRKFNPADCTYFSVSLMKPEATNRSVQNVAAQHVVVLDDVGGKLPLALAIREAPPPSYKIETSPGNFHWGYILTKPEEDLAKLKVFWSQLKNSQWGRSCDGKDAARYMRMPYGNAYKPEYKGFNTKLVEWAPALTYSLDDLAEKLSVSIDPDFVSTVREAGAAEYADDVELQNDPGWRMFEKLNWIKGRQRPDGWTHVTCPWEHEHTQGTGFDTGTSYVAKGATGTPDFKCHHGHCDGRRWLSENGVQELFMTDQRFKDDYYAILADTVFKGSDIDPKDYAALIAAQPQSPAQKADIKATPFKRINGWDMPPRQFVYKKHYIRKFISASIAPGGVGKSTVAIAEAVAMATGKDILGHAVTEPLKVWYWNGEDPFDELQRRFLAVIQHFNLTNEDIELLEENLFFDSGRNLEIKIAFQEPRGGAKIAAPIYNAVRDEVINNKIDVVIIDPFVSSHSVSENDNNAIDVVAKAWAKIADVTNCAIDLVHHVRKTNGQEATVEDARGASALLAAVRSARVFNAMSADEAARSGVHNQRLYFKEDNGKANLAPAAAAGWYKISGVELPNGDSVATVDVWQWPNIHDQVTDEDLVEIQKRCKADEPSESSQAADWVGHVVADVMGLNAGDKSDKARIKELLKVWLKEGNLCVKTAWNTRQGKSKKVISSHA